MHTSLCLENLLFNISHQMKIVKRYHTVIFVGKSLCSISSSSTAELFLVLSSHCLSFGALLRKQHLKTQTSRKLFLNVSDKNAYKNGFNMLFEEESMVKNPIRCLIINKAVFDRGVDRRDVEMLSCKQKCGSQQII